MKSNKYLIMPNGYDSYQILGKVVGSMQLNQDGIMRRKDKPNYDFKFHFFNKAGIRFKYSGVCTGTTQLREKIERYLKQDLKGEYDEI